MITYKTDSKRLMNTIVKPDNVGGFVVTHKGTETLYALAHDGAMYSREAVLNGTHFDRKDVKWNSVSEIPVHAEWIGQYKTPANL